MIARQEANAVRRLALLHLGHHTRPPVSIDQRQRESAEAIRAMAPEERQAACDGLRRGMESPCNPPEVRGRMAELLGLVESKED